MIDDFDKNSDRYGDYFKEQSDDFSSTSNQNFTDKYGTFFNEKPTTTANSANKKNNNRIHKAQKPDYRKSTRKRKGLKWKLLALTHNKPALICIAGAIVIITITSIVVSANNNAVVPVVNETQETTEATTAKPASHKIEGIAVKDQSDLLAGCESYACTVVLQYLNFDIDEYQFVDNYLITKPVEYGDDGVLYGPDMNSAFAGDIYYGYGIYAPAMAKSMNKYLTTTDRNMTANVLKGETLDDLCHEYIDNDIPVMVWATGYMADPYIKTTWTVNYTDENATKEMGDTEGWYAHEHCMVLFGYDDKNYYFSDSVAAAVSVFEKSTSEDKFQKMGSQAIVVK